MLFTDINTVYSESYRIYKYTLWVTGGIYNNRFTSKGYRVQAQILPSITSFIKLLNLLLNSYFVYPITDVTIYSIFIFMT